MPVRRLGLSGKLLVGTAGATAANECTVLTDVTLNFDIAEAELRTRGSQYASSGLGKTKVTISATLVRVTDDAQYQTIRNAIFNQTAIAIKATSNSTGDGIDGDFVLAGGQSFNEPLEDYQTVAVTLSLNTDLREPTLVTGTGA